MDLNCLLLHLWVVVECLTFHQSQYWHFQILHHMAMADTLASLHYLYLLMFPMKDHQAEQNQTHLAEIKFKPVISIALMANHQEYLKYKNYKTICNKATRVNTLLLLCKSVYIIFYNN